jgi:hypothetical protein
VATTRLSIWIWLRAAPSQGPRAALFRAHDRRAQHRRDDPYVTPGRARTSPLVWHLFGTNTSRPWDAKDDPAAIKPERVKLMPPSARGRSLRPEEIHTVVQWIDVGAPYDAVGGPVGGELSQHAQAR